VECDPAFRVVLPFLPLQEHDSEVQKHDSTAGSGHTFQADATTRTTIPVNVTQFDCKSNLPIRTAPAPTMGATGIQPAVPVVCRPEYG
jgi:hypothetical protein